MVKNINEDQIEKEILKKIESKNNKQTITETTQKKTYEHETLSKESNTEIHNSHFDMSTDKITNSIKKKQIKKHFYNETLGEYVFQTSNTNTNPTDNSNELNRNCLISKGLIDREEILNLIFPQGGKKEKENIDYDLEENTYPRLFQYLNNYRDVLCSNSDLAFRQNFMNVYLFHILNHVMKRKEEIEINNKIDKIHQKRNNISLNNKLKEEFFVNEEEEYIKNYSKEYITSEEYYKEYKKDINYENLQDQGFTTPRVLIIVPYKKHAKVIIDELVNILKGGEWKGITNQTKFKEDFDEIDSMNDCFRMGISYDYLEKKLKLYQSFDVADIIIASPLGLKLATNTENQKVKVYDFLSSIEILLLDFSEVFLYQNLEHLEEVLGFINKPPKNNQNIVDINRIKDNVKDYNLQYLRQNIIISHYKALEIELIAKKYFKNVEGIYTLYENYQNVLIEKNDDHEVKNNIKLEFKLLKSVNDMEIFDYKFNFFTKNVYRIINP